MNFLAPLMLGGLALASAPIIIHLLNRRRFITVDWAPMRYLKLTLRTNRRRLQLEQWLLLAIRTLAVLLLFLAAARPVLSGTGLGDWLGGGGRVDRLLVLDDSLSMGLRGGGAGEGGVAQSAFSRARGALDELIDRISTRDAVTVLTATGMEQPLVSGAQLDGGEKERLTQAVDALQPTQAGESWAAIFDRLDELMQAGGGRTPEVTLLTDLRRPGWTDGVSEVSKRWAEAGVTLRIVDVGAEPTGNAALLELTLADRATLVGESAKLIARIRNDGAEAMPAESAVLTVDDEERTVQLPEVAPGATVEVVLEVTLTEPGQHAVSLSLRADALPEDNRRFLVLDARQALTAQLVDGEPGATSFGGETDFLKLAFSIGGSRWRPEDVVDSQWLASPMTAPDLVVLANVASIPPERVKQLREMVEAGTGVMIFVGDQVDPVAWNQNAYRGGRGLLPAKLDRTIEVETPGLNVMNVPDTPLSVLTRIDASRLATVAPRRAYAVTLPTPAETGEVGDEAATPEGEVAPPRDAEPVRVLARWNDEAGTPAVIEKRIGKGRVLLWTVTADRAWSDWPLDPSYVLAVREAASAMAGGGASPESNLIAGQAIRLAVDANRPPVSPRVNAPGVDTAVPLTPVREGEGNEASQDEALIYDATRQAGVYRLTWTDPTGGEATRLYAVSPDSAESDLAPLEEPRLRELLGPLDPQVVRLDDASASGRGREQWWPLLLGVLMLILLESGVAAWVGREH